MFNNCCMCKSYDNPDDYIIKVWEGLKICKFDYETFEEETFKILEKSIKKEEENLKVVKTVQLFSYKYKTINPFLFQHIAEELIIDTSKNNPYCKIHSKFIISIVGEKMAKKEDINFISILFTFLSLFKTEEKKEKKSVLFYRTLLKLGNTNALSYIYFHTRFREFLELNLKLYLEFVMSFNEFGDSGYTMDDFKAIRSKYSDNNIDEFLENIIDAMKNDLGIDEFKDTFILTEDIIRKMFVKREFLLDFGQLRSHYINKRETIH